MSGQRGQRELAVLGGKMDQPGGIEKKKVELQS